MFRKNTLIFIEWKVTLIRKIRYVRLFNWFLRILISNTLRELLRELAKFSMLVLHKNCGYGLNKLLSNLESLRKMDGGRMKDFFGASAYLTF